MLLHWLRMEGHGKGNFGKNDPALPRHGAAARKHLRKPSRIGYN